MPTPPGKSRRQASRMVKPRGAVVTRAEFDRMVDALNERGRLIEELREEIERSRRVLKVQFERMAQMQMDIDLLKRSRS